MTFLWLVAGAALLAAVLAWRHARAAARRLEQLTQMYWELKYQHSELRAQVQQLRGTTDAPAGAPATPDPRVAAPRTDAFVPLSRLRDSRAAERPDEPPLGNRSAKADRRGGPVS